jgi:hypothetical protein
MFTVEKKSVPRDRWHQIPATPTTNHEADR